MAKSFPAPAPDLQIEFWARLQQIRSKYLGDALAQTVRRLNVADIDRELETQVGSDLLAPLTRAIASSSIFPWPSFLA